MSGAGPSAALWLLRRTRSRARFATDIMIIEDEPPIAMKEHLVTSSNLRDRDTYNEAIDLYRGQRRK